MAKEDETLKEKSAFLFEVLKRYDHYVATTNFKVGLMMSFLGIIIFSLIVRVVSISPAQIDCNYLYYSTAAFSFLTIASSVMSAVYLLKAVFPNTHSDSCNQSLIFFGDVARCDGKESGYALKVKNASYESLVDDLCKQTYIVAEIVDEKFRLLKVAVGMTIYGVVPLLSVTLLLLILQGVM